MIHAASEAGQNVDSYVTDVLFATTDESDNQNLGVIIKAVKSKFWQIIWQDKCHIVNFKVP